MLIFYRTTELQKKIQPNKWLLYKLEGKNPSHQAGWLTVMEDEGGGVVKQQYDVFAMQMFLLHWCRAVRGSPPTVPGW